MVFPRVGSEVFCSYSRISLYFDLNGIFLKLYLFALSVHNIPIRSHVNSANTKRHQNTQTRNQCYCSLCLVKITTGHLIFFKFMTRTWLEVVARGLIVISGLLNLDLNPFT